MLFHAIFAAVLREPPSLQEYKKKHPALVGREIACNSCGNNKQRAWKQKGKTIHRCSRCNKALLRIPL